MNLNAAIRSRIVLTVVLGLADHGLQFGLADGLAGGPGVGIAGAEIRVQPHAGRRVDADPPPRHLRHEERDAPRVRRRPAGVSSPVRPDHVTLAPAGAMGFSAVFHPEACRVIVAPMRKPRQRHQGPIGCTCGEDHRSVLIKDDKRN